MRPIRIQIKKSRGIRTNLLIDASVLAYFVSIYLYSFIEGKSDISKYCAIPCLILLSVYAFRNDSKLWISRFEVIFSAFILFCIVSILWSKNVEYAWEKCWTLIQIFALCLLLHNYVVKENKADLLLFSIMLGGVALAITVITTYGVSTFFSLLRLGNVRIGSEITNTNVIGINTAYSAILLLWYYKYYNMKITVVPLVICLLVALGSGSRKVILILFFGIALLYLFRGNGKERLRNFIFGTVVFLLLYQLLQLPMFASIMHRFEQGVAFFSGSGQTDSSMLHRAELIEVGLNSFLNHPFTGVGIGNARTIALEKLGRDYYLHNNYVELLASIGIIGTGVYYCFFAIPLLRIKHNLVNRSPQIIIAYVFLFLELIIQTGAVRYYDKVPYLLFLLIFVVTREQALRECR